MSQPHQPHLLERERERIYLEGALSATLADQPGRPRAIFVTGQPGSGRTAVVQLGYRLAAERAGFATLNGSWPAGGDGPDDLRQVLPEAAFKRYDEVGQTIDRLERTVDAAQLSLGLPSPANPTAEERYRAVQAIPGPALHFLIRRLYTTYDPSQLSQQAAAFLKTGLEHIITLTATNLSQLRDFVEEVRAELTAAEWDIYLRPEESRARAVGQGLTALHPDKALLVVIDDLKLPEGASDRWLRLVVEESGRTLWLIGGASRPGWTEPGQAELTPEPLSRIAVADWFKAAYQRELPGDQLEWMFRASAGEPLAVALAAALLAGGMAPPDVDAAISRTASDKLEGLFLFLVEESGLLNEAERLALYRLAILQPRPHFLNEYAPLAAEAGFPYDPALPVALFNRYPWLTEQTLRAGMMLHPVLKAILRRYLLVERRRFSQPVQEGIIEPARTVAVRRLNALEQAMTNEEGRKVGLAVRARDREWGERVADVAYYRFWLDEAVGWFFLLPRILMALAYNRQLARRLVALAEEMSSTFYVEGQEFLPYLRALLVPGYNGGRSQLDQKLKALEGLEELGTSGRGRWFRAENLGERPESGGSPEAELRGLLKWFQARIYEEAGQYERTASLYEGVLATNVAMPDMQKAAARSALYLAVRFRLKGAMESAYSALARAAELDPHQTEVQRALFYQSVRSRYFTTALKAADALSGMPEYEAQGELFTIFALYALERLPEVQTELRSYLDRPTEQTRQARATFGVLAKLAGLPQDSPALAELVAQLPG